MLVVEPIPGGDDDVALDALRSWRLRMGQLAFGDAIRPVREITESRAQVFDDVANMGTPDCPDWMRRNQASSEFANLPSGNGTSRGTCHGERAYRMAVGAAVDFIKFRYSFCVTFSGIFPLPPNSLFSGIFSIEYQ